MLFLALDKEPCYNMKLKSFTKNYEFKEVFSHIRKDRKSP